MAILNLLTKTITTALTGWTPSDVCLLLQELRGAAYLGIQANFTYGSGGTTCKVYIQTSFDGGLTWVDIACFAFATASARRVSAVTTYVALAAAATPTDGSLADNTILNGAIGDRLRVKLTTTGRYAGGTTLAIAVVPR